MSKFMRLLQDKRGATAIEYGLIVALICLAVIGAFGMVADETILMWNHVAETMDEAVT